MRMVGMNASSDSTWSDLFNWLRSLCSHLVRASEEESSSLFVGFTLAVLPTIDTCSLFFLRSSQCLECRF